MAQVFRAFDPRLGREFALKVLGGELRPERLARFAREGEAVAALRHPNVVGVHECGVLEGRPYLAFDLVEGARPLDEVWRLAPLEVRLDQLEAAAQGLAHAHERGVVHRDVKPDNVLVDAEGRVFVSDFGLAWIESSDRLTQTGAFMGTPHTMAPEQVGSARDSISPRTDVWALGVLLYLALTGRWPFEGASLTELMAQIARACPARPRSLNPQVGAAVEATCLRALSAESSDRQADAGAFLEALRAGRRGRSERGAWIPGLALAALLAATLVAWGLWHARALEPPSPSPPLQPSPQATTPRRPGPSTPPLSSASGTPPATRGDATALEVEPEILKVEGIRRPRLLPTTGGLFVCDDDPRAARAVRRFSRSAGGDLQGAEVAKPPGGVHALGEFEGALICVYEERKGTRGLARLEEDRWTVLASLEQQLGSRVQILLWRLDSARVRAFVVSQKSCESLLLGGDLTFVAREPSPWAGAQIDSALLAPERREVALVGIAQTGISYLRLFDWDSAHEVHSQPLVATSDSGVPLSANRLAYGNRAGMIVTFTPRNGLGDSFVEEPIAPMAHEGSVAHLVVGDGALYSLGRAREKNAYQLKVWNPTTYERIQVLDLRGRIGGLSWDPSARGVWIVLEDRAELRRCVD